MIANELIAKVQDKLVERQLFGLPSKPKFVLPPPKPSDVQDREAILNLARLDGYAVTIGEPEEATSWAEFPRFVRDNPNWKDMLLGATVPKHKMLWLNPYQGDNGKFRTAVHEYAHTKQTALGIPFDYYNLYAEAFAEMVTYIVMEGTGRKSDYSATYFALYVQQGLTPEMLHEVEPAAMKLANDLLAVLKGQK